MGTIVSPVTGHSVYHGAILPVVYRSDAVNFGCGLLSEICLIQYLLDAVDVSGLVNVSQTGPAPQTQAARSITMPTTGATAQIDVDARGVGGQQNDTAAATYNLVAVPTATCNPATLVAQTTAQLNGTIAGTLLAGGSARFVYGIGAPNTNLATTYTAGAVNATLTGLTPNTTYNYRIEVIDEFGNIVATSTQCSLTTLAATGGSATSDAQLVKLCSITEVIPQCDQNGDPILMVVVTSADGDPIPTSSTEFPAPATGAGAFSTMGYYRSYYADTNGVYLTVQPTSVQPCGSSGTTLIKACDTVDTVGGATPGVCGTNQQVIDAVDIQDSEQKNSTTGGNAVNVNDNDLEMAGQAEPGETDYMIGIRFTANIPQGATICNAYIQFTAEGSTSIDPFTARVEGENVDNSALFTTVAGSINSRAKTTANVSWTPPLWTSNAAGAGQRTPDLSAIVQEIVDRAGWAAGNAMAFFVVPTTATGYRRASSIQDGAEAPKLHVEFVVDQATTNNTYCVPFYKEINLETGLATGNNYRINDQTNAWEAYTPTGVVTDGDCVCPGVDGDSGSTFQALCFEDSTGTKFLRVIAIDGNSGQYKVVGEYATDLSGTYTPIGIAAPCPSDPVGVDVEVVTLCDTATTFLRHIVHGETGSVSGVYDTALDGETPYTAVGAVGVCGGSTTDLEAVDFCLRANTAGAGYAVGDQIKLTRWFNTATNTQVSEVAFNMTAGGSAVATPLTAANFDECPGGGLATTVRSHMFNVAAGASWTVANIPAGQTLVGLSFTVLQGTASVNDSDNTAITLLPVNYSAGWDANVDGVLIPPISITAAAASRVVVTMLTR